MTHARWLVILALGIGLAGQAASAQMSGASPEGAAQEGEEPKYDFGDFSSETLVGKAWEALDAEDDEAVDAFTSKCIQLYESKAIEQNEALTDYAPKDDAFSQWALNDVGTSYFIRGKMLLAQGKTDEAKAAFRTIIEKLNYAQCWDPKGWFWKPAEAAQDQLQLAGTGYDFGDYTSQTLTTKAWDALAEGDHKAVALYTDKTFSFYEEEARKQQATLAGFASKEKAFDYWALNDVGTSHFIRAKSLQEQGKTDEAREHFKRVVEQYSYAQCWDPQGWFWKVADASKDQLDLEGTDYDYGDYTSQTMTTKAWEALGAGDHQGVEVYTKKCITLYGEEAQTQQGALSSFAPKEKAFDYWALNDVATCYFILGESLMAQGKLMEAKEAFDKVVNELKYAQCWDPKGWFWKVSVASRGRLNKIIAMSGGG